ncbi:glycoside hydrolase family 3 C-terminal domain-containing protein [Melioribacteraceae bacterium 4301-Me]|uniref:glycoside hydrolase family 3 C-terminal domain-containing protein n=1 Tax=Pyranulibacter aquaticus TaxID=3163344 RepID=UPI0035965087
MNKKKLNSKKVIIVFLVLFQTFQCCLFAQTIEDRINNIISQMTIEEEIQQLHKEGGFNTADNTRLKIPGFIMSDGPHGVRNGYATSFPVGIALAATWDTNIVRQVGIAMGEEFRGKGINQALGPCLDLTLDPRNGRSPESSGEDPYLSAMINTALVIGIQSTPTIATVKHFFSEYKQAGRTQNNYLISDKMMMEHYGLQFRRAIQIGGAMSVMNAYNLINGEKCGESYNLLTNILRKKWGFPFYVVSDWGSLWNAQKAINAGCDIEMGSDLYQTNLLNLYRNGIVSKNVIDEAVRRVLRTKITAGLLDYYPPGDPLDVNSIQHREICLQAGKESIVLLKNQDNILPLNKNSINKIALIGPSAGVMITDGSGSSWVEPLFKVSPLDGIKNYVGENKVLYAKGCDIANGFASDISDAINYAKQADVVIYFGGLDGTQEGEGFDRANGSIELPGKQKDLIKYLSSVNKNLIVVLISGGICGVNYFINDIKALLYAFYPGQEGGNAIAQVLFGDYNPSGKLPVTMPVNDSQLPPQNFNFDDDYGGGYRWFDKQGLTPQFAFGFGLSYTTFSFSNLFVSPQTASAGQIVNVSVDITNTGNLNGNDVVQLYLSYNGNEGDLSLKQLKGFKRVNLNPGETKNVIFQITPNELYVYNESTGNYEVKSGYYIVKVGDSSDNLPLSSGFEITPAEPLPDLQIANIRTIPPYPLVGDTVRFIASIINYGTGASPNGEAHEVIFKVNEVPICKSDELTNSIPAGGMALANSNKSINNSYNFWVADKPGTYSIEAEVNSNNLISETIYSNNTKRSEVKVYNLPPQNLALNKTVFVSSVERAGLEGEKAVDGSYSTRWSSQFSDPQWIVIDFGQTIEFNQIKLNWETAYAKEYLIQISDDNLNWNSAITLIHQTDGKGGIEKYDVQSKGRYLRIYGIKRATQWGYSLYEIEVFNVVNTTNVNEHLKVTPQNFLLEQNYPNPFNPSTVIRYHISAADALKSVEVHVKLKVYDLLGREVATLVNERKSPGVYEIKFDGAKLPSGVYFYRIVIHSDRLEVGDFISTKKMILLR